MKGIYAYWDNKLSQYVYIGKDSYIDKNERHKEHLAPSKYDVQPFNRVVQNNPERYEYRILMEGDYNDKQLNKMERFCIKHLKTFHYDYPERNVFNFTKGGDGKQGYNHSEESKQKMSEVKKGENNPMYGKKRNKESRKKQSESIKGKNNHRWKDYSRIIKNGFYKGKQVYAIRYNGNRLKRSVNKESLKKWFNENYPNVKLIDETKEENNND